MAGKQKTWYAMKKVSSHYDRVRYLDAIMNKTDLTAIHQEHRDIYHMLLLGLSVDFDLKIFMTGIWVPTGDISRKYLKNTQSISASSALK